MCADSSQPYSNNYQQQTHARMPALDTMQNDEAFLTLLSSQRELLNKLNMENAIRREQQIPQNRAPVPKRGSIIGMDPHSLMNKPIMGSGMDPHLMDRPNFERRSSLDMLFSRRFSLGISNDNFVPNNVYPEPERCETFDDCNLKMDAGLGDFASRKMKRRRSSMALLSSLFLDDPKQASRRLSMLSTGKSLDSCNFEPSFEFDMMPMEQQFMEQPIKRQRTEPPLDLMAARNRIEPTMDQGIVMSRIEPPIDQGNLRTRMEPQIDQVNARPTMEPPINQGNVNIRMEPPIDPGTVKNTMVNFASAMEKSAQSQQDIHNWDRKMGLKRSHSKTMRLSMRSRKKLRSILKKEINSYANASLR